MRILVSYAVQWVLLLLVPDTYEKLQAILSTESPEHQAVILERMIKCNHPSLSEGFRSRLINLFGYLLQHLQDTAVSTEVCDVLSSELLAFHWHKASLNLNSKLLYLKSVEKTISTYIQPFCLQKQTLSKLSGLNRWFVSNVHKNIIMFLCTHIIPY